MPTISTGGGSDADNKSKRDKADRSKVLGSEGYEVGYVATKHGISREQARNLIKKVGNNRDKLNRVAEKL
ncbi:DUF3606 domain-containing protein [Rhodoplanes sp. Z2-YC6860]|uniref:DUF3606 domain-containing protein n=1 Tax=Rhodoplanes sp. Z2-YC6860 TaxID=674703 RepID=UPI00078C448F|nr:DUF3606 domain-containing protein [Rhodoplanes sp. Z2-YC6860]AMN39727.1 hypothetical protein RHPLAN_12710 [Rhodoplanes sp. Z2-YC6860]